MTEKVTREDLENAYRAIGPEPVEPVEVIEEEVSEEIVPEPEVEETDELEVAPEEDDELSQVEKTKRGREQAEKIRKAEAESSRLASELSDTTAKLARLEGRLDEIGRQGPQDVAPPEELDPDETLTVREMREILRQEQAKDDAEKEELAAKRVAYSEEYTRLTYDRLEDNANKDEIIKLFKSDDAKYDQVVFGDPAKDFEYNFANAEREVLSKQNAELQKKLAGKNKKLREDDPVGAGVGGGTPETQDVSQPKSTPGPMAASYLAHLDKKDPEAAKKLRDKHY